MKRVAREFSSYPSLRSEEDRERNGGIKERRITEERGSVTLDQRGTDERSGTL